MEIFFTDGSGRSKHSKNSGFACIQTFPEFKGWQMKSDNSTNIVMEGRAILHAINQSSTNCIIITDSEFWIKMLTEYIPNRIRKGQSIDSFKNPELCKTLYSKYQEKKDKITLKHVFAHNSKASSHPFQEYARVWNNTVDYFTNHFPSNLQLERVTQISEDRCRMVFNENTAGISFDSAPPKITT